MGISKQKSTFNMFDIQGRWDHDFPPKTWSSQPQEYEKIIYEYAIKVLTKLKIKEGKIYGEFQIGKQTNMSHKNLQHLTSSKIMELLHMNLMEPIQVKGLGGINNTLCVKNDKVKLIYDFMFSEMSDKMLEDYVQLMQSEVEISLGGEFT